MLGTGGGAGAVAAQVAEGVELLDEAEAEAGLGGDEVAQSQLEGAVAHRVERAEGQGGGALVAGGGEDAGRAVAQGDNHGGQADAHAGRSDRLTRRALHGHSVCQASAAGIRPTASASTR